ncbi:MAG: hypothetical protein GX763_04475 [Clostridiaceae bacterium]|nr:hypothetical protein [Clostridiaceae bacterium]
MKKIIAVTAMVLAVILLTVGCSRAGMIGKLVDEVVQGQKDEIASIFESQSDDDDKEEPTETVGETVGETVDQGKTKSPEGLFSEYNDSKNTLIRNITQTIYEDPDLGFAWDPGLINIHEVDAVMWAAFILWEDAEIVEQTGRFLEFKTFMWKNPRTQQQSLTSMKMVRSLFLQPIIMKPPTIISSHQSTKIPIAPIWSSYSPLMDLQASPTPAVSACLITFT